MTAKKTTSRETSRAAARRAFRWSNMNFDEVALEAKVDVVELKRLVNNRPCLLSAAELDRVIAYCPTPQIPLRKREYVKVPLAERFWPKIDRRGDDECWPWLAALDDKRYGRIKSEDGTQILIASRVSVTLDRGDPGELLVLHQCDTPACVNPRHLKVVTQSENMTECVDRGRHNWLSHRRGKHLN